MTPKQMYKNCERNCSVLPVSSDASGLSATAPTKESITNAHMPELVGLPRNKSEVVDARQPPRAGGCGRSVPVVPVFPLVSHTIHEEAGWAQPVAKMKRRDSRASVQ